MILLFLNAKILAIVTLTLAVNIFPVEFRDVDVKVKSANAN